MEEERTTFTPESHPTEMIITTITLPRFLICQLQLVKNLRMLVKNLRKELDPLKG